MTDPAERFIEAAVSPLADNPELEIAARRELTEVIAQAESAGSDSLDTAAGRLESAGRRPVGKWCRFTLYAATALVSAAVLVVSASSLEEFRQTLLTISSLGGGFGAGGEPLEKRLSKNLSPEQSLLLFGDLRRTGKADRFAALWQSQPDNPVYFAEYAGAYLSQHDRLPPDFMETAHELDPGNAWFPIIAAAVKAKEALDIGSVSGTSAPTSPGGVKLKPVKDMAKLDEALELIHEAAGKKRFENYQIELLKQRIPLLPARTDNLEWQSTAYFAGLSAPPALSLRYLADAVAAKSIRLAADKDTAGFQRLLADWEGFTDTLVRSDQGTVLDSLIAVALIRTPLKAMREAAAGLGLAEDAARLKALDDRFETWKTGRTMRPAPNGDLVLRSGIMVGLALPVLSMQTTHPPVLTDEDLKPGRLADHALAGRAMALIGWLILGGTALAAGLYRFRCSMLTRRLSDRLMSLLRPADWFWIFAAGLILPLLYYFAISRLTPLGGREWSLKASAFLVPSGQFSSMLWLMVVLPLAIARRRLARRGGAAGLSGGTQWFAWIAVVCGALALPVFGLTFHAAKVSQPMMIAAGGLLAVLQLYVLVAGIRALFSRQASLLRRATLARILLPVQVAGMAVMIGATLLFHAEEKHWVARDRLMEITVDAPSMSRFEYDVTRALKQELLELVTETR